MPQTLFGQLRGGSPRRFRGRKWLVRQKLTKRQFVLVLVFLVFVVIALTLGMYLGWWLLQNEERDSETSALFPARPKEVRLHSSRAAFFPSLELHEN